MERLVIDVFSDVDVTETKYAIRRRENALVEDVRRDFGDHDVSFVTNNCFYNGQAKNYMGTLAVTNNNYTCQRWETHEPHDHFYTETDFPEQTIPENYCRTTPVSARPWCYTTNKYKRWEYCYINNCNCSSGRFGNNCEYECHCADQSEACEITNGKCSSGCAQGWNGFNCQTHGIADKHIHCHCKKSLESIYRNEQSQQSSRKLDWS
ncbi:unnamed protein product [Mytilus coruscus]|uniref:Kringle domain-containing protein n=1 Tax=Mytilus coruscus TaxID=42192 RepID=A0A6J8A294_MYTCO|nr:unnamed protein product [Mytilus coruscus]